jgi:hypothetical protein
MLARINKQTKENKMAIEIELTQKMQEQIDYAEVLVENLYETTILDILDALAVSGYTLEKAEGENHASLAYISLLMENANTAE